ncbi:MULTISPECIES: hypothetical protein [Cysteiniphilum]|uniref:CS1 type fimbrial major subunit n=1 Tax=Cysteiniphilum litorale TaxID=2056700 RepID=A0A8J2Z3Z0_9GAMM|nr:MULTISPECIES: hypothetical protein [Cysteiniphilum]GGF93577.1 hypothetical protein GCM10010995_08420 [Cysteiniphilum litorale]
MNKLTKKILTGLTTASIVSVALLPTSAMAIGQTFVLNLSVEVNDHTAYSTNAITSPTYNPLTKKIDQKEILKDLINYSGTTNQAYKVTLDTQPVLSDGSTGNYSFVLQLDNAPDEINDTNFNTGVTVTLNSTNNSTNINFKELDMSGAPKGTYTYNGTMTIELV